MGGEAGVPPGRKQLETLLRDQLFAQQDAKTSCRNSLWAASTSTWGTRMKRSFRVHEGANVRGCLAVDVFAVPDRPDVVQLDPTAN